MRSIMVVASTAAIAPDCDTPPTRLSPVALGSGISMKVKETLSMKLTKPRQFGPFDDHPRALRNARDFLLFGKAFGAVFGEPGGKNHCRAHPAF